MPHTFCLLGTFHTFPVLKRTPRQFDYSLSSPTFYVPLIPTTGLSKILTATPSRTTGFYIQTLYSNYTIKILGWVKISLKVIFFPTTTVYWRNPINFVTHFKVLRLQLAMEAHSRRNYNANVELYIV